MKNFFAAIFNKSQADKVQYIDPKKILFSIPTLSDDMAPLKSFSEKLSGKDFGFHEDDWCQIEFFSKSQLKTIQQILKEYKQFEQEHRVNQGWNAVYLRKIQRVPVMSSIQDLEKMLGAKAGDAPILFTHSSISGKVKNGFTLPLGGNITLYGYIDGNNIPVLGASVGKNPDDSRLTDAFLKLNASNGLFVVDWRAQLLIIGASSDSQVEVWRP